MALYVPVLSLPQGKDPGESREISLGIQVNKLGSLHLGSVIFGTTFQLEGKGVGKIYTVERRFNKPLL